MLVQNVSWTMMPGQRVGLVGSNGCGKSTLLRCISGYQKVRHPQSLPVWMAFGKAHSSLTPPLVLSESPEYPRPPDSDLDIQLILVLHKLCEVCLPRLPPSATHTLRGTADLCACV